MVRQSACVLDDLMDDSEISFDSPAETVDNKSSTTKYFSDPELASDNYVPVESEEDAIVCSTTKTLTPTHEKPTPFST